jgi:hypothetical protein
MIAITSKKYIHDIAEVITLPLTIDFSLEEINFITILESVVNASIIVYTALTKIIGLIIGKVIFQKVSQEVAPSICTDSYIAGEID